MKYRFESFATPRADVFELRKSVPDNSVLVILCNAGNPKQNQYAYIPCNNAGDLWITIQGKVTIDDIASEPSIATPDGFPETSDLRYNKQWFEDASRAIARKHGYIAGMV